MGFPFAALRTQPPVLLSPDLLQEPGQVSCRRQWLAISGLDDGLGHAFGFWFVAEILERPAQLFSRYGGQNLGCGPAARSIHAHVERAFAHIRETALSIVHLHARHAQVGQKNIYARRALGGDNCGQAGKVGMVQLEWPAQLFQALAGSRQVVGIEIASDQSPAGHHTLQHFA